MNIPPVRPWLRIAVVGAGVGGLCAAAALIAGGADVLAYDQEQNPEPAGFGLQLAPNATRLLRRLGVLDRLAPGQVVIPEARELRRWDDGALIARTPLGATGAVRYGAPYLAVLRADLLQALREVVGAHHVRPGYRLTWLAESADRVDLSFGNGLTTSADVVVGADGLRSTVRSGLSADLPIFAGQRVFRGLTPAACLPPRLSEPRIAIWARAGQHCVVYPVAGRRWVNFAATVPASAPGRSDTDVATDLAAAYAGWDPELRAVLGAAKSLGVWPLYDREPLERWSTGRVTVVGDAAHPMLPFLAQGANQAVEDAVALAALLAGASAATLAARLALYQAFRADRTAVVARCSRRGASTIPEPAANKPGPRVLVGKPPGDLDWLYGYDCADQAEQVLTASRSPERSGQRQTGCGP